MFIAGFTTDVLLVEVCGLEKPLLPLAFVPLLPLAAVVPLLPFVAAAGAAVAGLELNVLGAPFEAAAAPLCLLWPYDCIEFTQLAGRIGQLRDNS